MEFVVLVTAMDTEVMDTVTVIHIKMLNRVMEVMLTDHLVISTSELL